MFFPVGTIVAERLLYFPSIGFCLLVALPLSHALAICHKHLDHTQQPLPTPPPSSSTHPQDCGDPFIGPFFRWCRRVQLGSLALLLLAGGYRSHVRNGDWVSERRLFDEAIKVAPTNVKVLSNMGKELLNENPPLAMQYLRIALAYWPIQPEGHVNLGLTYGNLEHDLHALRHLGKATDFGNEREFSVIKNHVTTRERRRY